MDNSGVITQRPVVLVVEQIREMEKMIRSGILACSSQVDFCSGLQTEILQQITVERPGLIIAPLQMENLDAFQLIQEVIQKTGEAIPGIFIRDPQFASVEERLLGLGSFEFLPRHFLMSDLLSKVEQLVGTSSQRREYRADGFLTPLERKKFTAA